MSTPRETETEAFARRLSELRDGSGRSYGALARRVGVSASTLHRYCSGQTVPMEYTPVERLARLCGCQGEELTALHRLWVRADADRGRRQESGAGAAGREVTAVPGEAPEADPAPAPEPLAEPDEPGRRGRRWAYATVLAAAVLALVLLIAFAENFPSAADRRQSAAEQVGGGANDSSQPHPDGSRSTAPASPDATASAPGDGPRVSTDHGQRPPEATASGRSTAPSEPERSRLPFTWSTNDHIWQNGCGHTYLVNRGPAHVPPPPAEADAEPWARSVGAVHGADTGVRITVQGKSDKAVVLEAMHVRVTARRAPPKHNAFRMTLGCGGALTPRLFDVDLDKPRPIARSMAGNDAGEPIPAVSFPYKVSATDPETLLVTGRTVGCDCDWYLELEWSSGDRSGTVRIDDSGQPFRTSGIQDRPLFDYGTGSGRWNPAA
ncbi:helix-turn-helix domain-containing protein [Streptomyces lunaelactis]|uniref:helix-turn-helix domain-containing protein n=1 Tax=Streptomyces lunaelactis TaxID=1535768 RepID=UPI001584616C|nr:helix-turn-helix transcriptional regulator [Streptomyces lunaelactis]NUK64294.1 helix-turn-helix domain-containing protein [Streptomyces lunaelactis]